MSEAHLQALQGLIEFWFAPENRSAWFNASPQTDAEIRQRFEGVWKSAARGELDGLLSDPSTALAMVILLDQVPLNMYREDKLRYSTADAAVSITRLSLDQGWDDDLGADQKAFLYMPLMHSENMDDQNLSVACYEKAGLDDNARFARHHREIVRRFGRFPHRNHALGRESTPEELEYLASDEAFKA